MYHESVASIANRWKHQVNTLGQRIDSEREKQKFYENQINFKKETFQKRNDELKEKRNTCYESRATLKTFEENRIELTNSMAHLERELFLQQKNNKIDQERYEELFHEVVSDVANLLERASNFPKDQLTELKTKKEELEKKQAAAKNLCNQKRVQLAVRKTQLSTAALAKQAANCPQSSNSMKHGETETQDKNKQSQEMMYGTIDDQGSTCKKVARVTGIVQPMRSVRGADEKTQEWST